MRPCLPAVIVSMLTAVALAAPPLDEDRLPDGAFRRLGSRQRRWRPALAHTFLHEGRTLLTLHAGLDFVERDVATGQLLRVQSLKLDAVDAVRLSRDGTRIAVERHGLIEIWDVAPGRKVREIGPGDAKAARKGHWLFQLSPDGRWLVTAEGGRVVCMEVRTGTRHDLGDLKYDVAVLEFVRDGAGILIGSPQRMIVRDVVSGEVQWERRESSASLPVERVSLFAGGRFAWLPIRGSRMRPGVYDLDTGFHADDREPPLDYWCKCGTADGRLVCVRDGDGHAIWNRDANAAAPEIADLREPLGFTPDGRSILGRDAQYTLQRWDAATGKPQFPPLPAPAHLDVTHLLFRPDGTALISACEDGGLVRLWNLESPRPRTLLELRECSFLHTLVLAADGRRLLHKSKGPALDAWDLDDAKQLFSVESTKPFGYQRLALQVSPDGGVLYSLFPMWDGAVTFGFEARDMATGNLKVERAEPSLGGCLAFAPDARQYASAMTGVHDTATGKLRAPLPVDGMGIGRMLFSPDGSRLALFLSPALAKGPVDTVLVETASGHLIHRLASGPAFAAAFSPDGRRLVTASLEAIQVWDARTGRELRRWAPGVPNHDGGRPQPAAKSLAISPDGQTLASGHSDGTILLWRMPALDPPRAITGGERDQRWADLAAADPARAWQAIARLSDSPTDAAAILDDRLRPTPHASLERLRTWIAELDAPSFARREGAMRELTHQLDLMPADWPTPMPGSPEQLRRLRDLDREPRALRDTERLRRWRAVVILERLAPMTARPPLQRLATSPAGCAEMQAAAAALQRINR